MKRYILAAIKDILDEPGSIQFQAARDTSTSPRILERLAQSDAEDVRRAVAYNRNTPENALLQLANDPNFGVKTRLTERSVVPDKVLLALLDDEAARMRYWVLSAVIPDGDDPPRMAPGPEVFMKLAEDDDDWIRNSLAKSSAEIELPIEVQKKLACDKDLYVRKSLVLYRENVPTEIIDLLMDDPEPSVRCALARDMDAPREYYEHFVKDPDISVRRALLLNSNTPMDVLERFLGDPDAKLRKYAEDRILSRQQRASWGNNT